MDEFKKYAVKGLGLSSMTLDRYQRATDAYINPTIIEERKLNVASLDVFSRLVGRQAEGLCDGQDNLPGRSDR